MCRKVIHFHSTVEVVCDTVHPSLLEAGGVGGGAAVVGGGAIGVELGLLPVPIARVAVVAQKRGGAAVLTGAHLQDAVAMTEDIVAPSLRAFDERDGARLGKTRAERVTRVEFMCVPYYVHKVAITL